MFVTDIRKEFYEVVANQVGTNSLQLHFFHTRDGSFGQRKLEL